MAQIGIFGAPLTRVLRWSVEAALAAGLTAAGVPGAVAVTSVLLFRLLAPGTPDWTALNYLEHQHDLTFIRLVRTYSKGVGLRRDS